MASADRARAVASPILDDLGLELYDLDYSGGTLRILADKPAGADTGGVSIDDLSTATRLISRALDESDVMAGSYTLEVSSPGLERPLRTPAHFAAAIGAEVSVKTTPEHQGERRITGRLAAADAESIDVIDDAGVGHHVSLADVQKARTVFEWGPTGPKSPSKGSKRASTEKARAR
jgi:ribosome maturation factor RimP